jgi:hypothetical protein
LENGKVFDSQGQSFGGNYYDLLENSFFFKESAVGRIATQRIEEWLNKYEKDYIKYGDQIRNMTDYIGDPIVREYIKDSRVKWHRKNEDV